MTDLRLIDPQPMETLPESGKAFLDYTFISTNEHKVDIVEVKVVRYMNDSALFKYHAWSYTATFEKGEG